jgi:hypothetical protein
LGARAWLDPRSGPLLRGTHGKYIGIGGEVSLIGYAGVWGVM